MMGRIKVKRILAHPTCMFVWIIGFLILSLTTEGSIDLNTGHKNIPSAEADRQFLPPNDPSTTKTIKKEGLTTLDLDYVIPARVTRSTDKPPVLLGIVSGMRKTNNNKKRRFRIQTKPTDRPPRSAPSTPVATNIDIIDTTIDPPASVHAANLTTPAFIDTTIAVPIAWTTRAPNVSITSTSTPLHVPPLANQGSDAKLVHDDGDIGDTNQTKSQSENVTANATSNFEGTTSIPVNTNKTSSQSENVTANATSNFEVTSAIPANVTSNYNVTPGFNHTSVANVTFDLKVNSTITTPTPTTSTTTTPKTLEPSSKMLKPNTTDSSHVEKDPEEFSTSPTSDNYSTAIIYSGSENNETVSEMVFPVATEDNQENETTEQITTPSLAISCPANLSIPSPQELKFPPHKRHSKEMMAKWKYNETRLSACGYPHKFEYYTVQYSADGQALQLVDSRAKNVSLSGLTVFTEYRVCVAAVSSCGISPFVCQNETTKPGIPEKPCNVSVMDVSVRSFRVTWSPMGDDPGGPSSAYHVLVNHSEHIQTVDAQGFETDTALVEGLAPFTVYCVSIQASSSEGSSDFETGPCVQTSIAVPETPINASLVNATSTSLTARWTPPLELAGPTNYTIRAWKKDSSHLLLFQKHEHTWMILVNLTPYTHYCYNVSAFTSAGESLPSPVFCRRTNPARPSAVTNLTGTCSNSECTFHWLSPTKMNGLLDHYHILFRHRESDVRFHQTTNTSITISQLDPETNCSITVTTLVRSVVQAGDPVSISLLTQANPGSSMVGVIASLVTLIVIGAFFGMLVLVLRWKRKMPQFGHLQRQRQAECETQTSETNMAIPIRATAKPVQLSQFEEHLRTMSADSGLKFSQEFEELNTISPSCPTSVAQLPENRPKNRWINILPFDHSRVKLLPIADDVSSDYINATYIPGHHSQREYIASQGPLPTTKDDFWRMIWEQNCSTIVMVTQLVERGKVKCESYWPSNTDEHHYGDLSVTLKCEDVRKSYTTRVFTVKLKPTMSQICRPMSSNAVDISERVELIPQFSIMEQASRQMQVKQLHFTMWPDFGCPENTSLLINFVKAVRKAVASSSLLGPIIVHCSAGVGRTGTFIAVDILLHHIQENDYVDVYGIVRAMRHYRSNMVQTEDQYIFIHECARDIIHEMEPAKLVEC